MVSVFFSHILQRDRVRRNSRLGRVLSDFSITFWMVLVAPLQAHAQFQVCNQSIDVLNLALGHLVRDAFQTTGWWTVGPNQCVTLIETELDARYVYVFAQDVFGRVVLSGATPMCVAPERFTIRGESDCLVRGYLEARFHEVDTLRSERWTLFIYPPG